ncbi:sensor histidine kinase [Natronoflexus pectinivorans]|uniref:histidine kinase n=1 Tax=Natronoflexus pectinivorans TaxID=682526 RepID=A0A4R2GGK1_9BACT|nr:ATP-binding protein [Natronoflexus pectinivorans]TCO07106.1 signal transduction histidine kinase [Natronoflexus pectinivorans]
MALLITLTITIILQFFAAAVAVKLTRVTKYNLSWILISFGFIFMAVQRLAELLPFIADVEPQTYRLFYIWLGAITSLFFAGGVFLIQKIFQYMKEVEMQTRNQEKALLNAIIQAEERERRRFATEIHDGLGPLLSTIKMSISSLAANEANDANLSVIKNTNIAIGEAIKSVQEISNNLSPHMLKNFGVAKAIRNFINKVNQSKGLKVTLKTNALDIRFPEGIEILVYRSVCELINNTIKHSEATKVEIDFQVRNSLIELKYKDNGVGFDTQNLFADKKDSGTGYFNMFSRIKSLHGTMEVFSNKNKGVYVIITIPANEK